MVGPKKVEEAIRTGEEDPMVEVDLEGLVVDLPSKTDSQIEEDKVEAIEEDVTVKAANTEIALL